MAMRLEYAVLPEPYSGRLQPLRLPLLLAVAAAALCAGGSALAGQPAAVRHFTTPAAQPTLSSAFVPVMREAGAAGSRVPTVGANGDVAAEIYATPGPAAAALRPAALPLALLALVTMPAAALGAVLLARRRAAGPRPAALASGGTAGPVARHRAVRRPSTALRAATTDGTGAVYQVQLGKPLDVTLVRGLDGGTYVLHVAAGPRQELVTPGDRVTRCGDPYSAEMWDAMTYGSVMYAIRAAQGGNIVLELERRGGDMSPLRPIQASQPVVYGATEELEASEADLRAEEEKRELENKRAALWRQAVCQADLKRFQDALVLFEEVIGMEFNIVRGVEPKSELLRISYYLMACVYSQLGNVDASLESLEIALIAGYNDRQQIFSDPTLARTRETEGFRQLMAVFGPPEVGLAEEDMEEWAYGELFEDEEGNFPDQTHILM